MKALAVMDSTACPDCGGLLHLVTVGQPALLRHGGYGATRTFTVRYCLRCPYDLLIETTEARP